MMRILEDNFDELEIRLLAQAMERLGKIHGQNKNALQVCRIDGSKQHEIKRVIRKNSSLSVIPIGGLGYNGFL